MALCGEESFPTENSVYAYEESFPTENSKEDENYGRFELPDRDIRASR